MTEQLAIALETSGRAGSVAIVLDGRVAGERQLAHDLRHAAGLLPALDEMLRELARSPRDVNELYVSAGPGSFTGLRVAITFAKTLALTTGCRVVAVPTVDVLARNAMSDAEKVSDTLGDRPSNGNPRPTRVSDTFSASDTSSERRRNGGASSTRVSDTFSASDTAPDDVYRLAVVLDAKRGQVYCGGFERTAGGALAKVLEACLLTPAELIERMRRPLHGVPGVAGTAVSDTFSRSGEEVSDTFSNAAPATPGTPLLHVLGEGLAYHRDAFTVEGVRWLDESLWPARAANVARVGMAMAAEGRYTDPDALVPIYIRRPEAEEVWERRHGK